jgi:hypothetical protein
LNYLCHTFRKRALEREEHLYTTNSQVEGYDDLKFSAAISQQALGKIMPNTFTTM